MSDERYDVVRIEVAKLQLKPGDRLLVTVPERRFTWAEFRDLYEELQQWVGSDIPCFISTDIIEYTVVEPATRLFGEP
jgi:hypothetical protein